MRRQTIALYRAILVATFLIGAWFAHGETHILGLFLKDQRIGIVTFNESRDGDLVFSKSESLLDGTMLGSELKVRSISKSWSKVDGSITRFEIITESSGRTQKVLGNLQDDRLQVSVTFEGNTTKKEILIPKGQILIDDPMNQIAAGKFGSKFVVFDPNIVDLVSCEIKTLPSEKIHGLIANVIEVIDPRAPLKVFLSSKGDLIEAHGPFEMIIKPISEAEAKSEGERPDIALASSVPIAQPISDFLNLKSLKLKISGLGNRTLPSDEHQTLSKQGMEAFLEIHPIQMETSKFDLTKQTDSRWLSSETYIPCDSPTFISRAKEIIGNRTEIRAKIEAIRSFVHHRMRANGGIGMLRSANDIWDTKEGVCRDHAILMATLLRAAKIPTRLVGGLVYGNDAFFYHAWVEVWSGTNWVGVDSTRPTMNIDATHIKTSEGSVSEAFTSFLLDGVKIGTQN